MFNTFKYDPETKSVQELRRASDPISARSSQHQACNNCHAKKLKCSGEKSGCERCVAGQLFCEYTRSSSRRGGRKSSGRNSTDSRGGSELAGSGGGTKPKSPSPRDDEYGDALDRLDPSMLGPDDGFDLRSLSLESGGDAMGSDVTGHGGGAYHGQQQHGAGGSWQQMPSQGQYGDPSGHSYMGASGPNGQGYDVGDYYGDYEGYTQYQDHQNDPRYWDGQQQ
ncbi:hypothetical protein Trco_004530 [Trichoderma cornu-damae]|uniref:Zn(2)-C6 fungal-type domain-containing protein n=1 Tax=Trichoderma cornu-damae TaxID=654480 RepID=A0A9P8QTF3_9HYPO|nr:hypothetical protein Trco_004530 [Trichoderma cornu-damae]